ncbi:hypothetical protein Tco_0751540 [Tanacetum coccineum]|uniref:Uncharacterized protein n=1 Tax=Tanacetum coccineum TaxID=301880 RepID=A0ABQ4Z4B5_9ASTR
MMWNSNTMLVNSKQQYYQKLSGTVMKEMSLNQYHLNDTCQKVQNHILASITMTTLTLWISAQKRSTLLLSLSIMLNECRNRRKRLFRLKEVVGIDVKKKWGYGFLTSVIVRRSDEYEFSYANLPRLSVNDVEDMYLLQVQDKLHHIPLEFMKDFNNALLMFIRRTMIKNMVQDIQLGVESYERTLNLTKPIMFFEGIDQMIPFMMTVTHKENKLGSSNKRLKGRDWTEYDVTSSREMLKKIDEILRHREQLRRLGEYVVGRPKIVNPCTFVRPL